MGRKRASVRTLPSGEKVVHTPDGVVRLIPEGRVEKFLAAGQEEAERQLAEIRDRMMAEVEAKRSSLDAGDPVPHDKRPL